MWPTQAGCAPWPKSSATAMDCGAMMPPNLELRANC